MNLDAILNGFEAIPTDWLILGAFAIFAAFDIVRAGARRASTLALALPLAALLFLAAEEAALLVGLAAQLSGPLAQSLLFAFLVVLSYIFIARIGLAWGGEAGQTIQAALGGVALTAIVATLWTATPALAAIWDFGPQVEEIFGASYRFWWLIGGYATLAYTRS